MAKTKETIMSVLLTIVKAPIHIFKVVTLTLSAICLIIASLMMFIAEMFNHKAIEVFFKAWEHSYRHGRVRIVVKEKDDDDDDEDDDEDDESDEEEPDEEELTVTTHIRI